MSTTINGSVTTSYWTHKLEVTEGTPNIQDNTSPLTVDVYIGRVAASGSYMYGAKISGTVEVTGAGSKAFSYKNSGQVNIGAGKWLKIATVTFPAVPHNDDGSKTVTVSESFTNNIKPASGKASGSVVLTTIARASQPSCVTWPEHTQNVGDFGDTISIHMNRKSDDFTHTVRYAFGKLSGTIATNVTTGTTWTIPLSFMDLLPNAVSGSGTIYVDTYNGTQFIGTKYCGFTATVPSTVIPYASIQVLDETPTKEKYGNLVKGLSKLYVKTTAAQAYSSPIVGYSVLANGVQYDKAEITTDLLAQAGTTTVQATVRDGRGRTSAAAKASFPVLDYVPPTISALSVHRCDEDGTENDQGEYILVTFSAAVTSLNDKNSATYTLGYKTSDADDYTKKPLNDLTGDYVVTDYSYIFAASSDYSYDVYIEVKDDIQPVARGTSASTGFTFMDWNDDGKSIAFGKVSEEGGGTLENALIHKQIGNTYSFSSIGEAETDGYILMARLEITETNADSPVTFVFSRRKAEMPMTVHVLFVATADLDPGLQSISYEGDNYGAFLVKSATSTWDLYVQKVNQSDTVTLNRWHTSYRQMKRIKLTFPGSIVEQVPQGLVGYYRATPAKMQSLLDYIYPVGSIYISYSHTNPANLFGGYWLRIKNCFLWAVDENGVVGLTGGEKEHTLTVDELPAHSHGSVYSQHAAGTKDKAWYNTSGSSVAYGAVSTGGGEAHNNMPPYMQVSMWQRTS